MNLVSDGWIPVVMQDGAALQVSLKDAFRRGWEIRDLAVRPDERVALMRLLIAVAQAALDGPVDEDDWKKCKSRLQDAACAYLEKWRPAFELFGDGQRFLQVAGLELQEDKWVPTSKLDFALATGNNPTLFDNGGGEERRFEAEYLARRLLAFQCFSPGGRIGVAQWGGRPTSGDGSSQHAPCLPGSMVHAYIRRANLLETVHVNLISRRIAGLVYSEEGWGKPIWERLPSGPDDRAAADQVTRTYLGRLVPLSRAIRLGEDGRRMILANGLSYPSFDTGGLREPEATVVVRKRQGKEEHGLLPLRQEAALWRELHSMLVKCRAGSGAGGPLALANLSEDESFDLWAGGMIADQAKPIELVESVFHVPAGLLLDAKQKVYERGVELASEIAGALEKAAEAYARALSSDGGSPGGAAVSPAGLRQKMRFLYWSDVDLSVQDLIDFAAGAGGEASLAQSRWGRTLRRAALQAFEAACPAEGVRQMRAYAVAEQELRGRIAQLLS
ncbi:MAG: CRISPR-associated protein CasA/Cse1 [Bryobacteraceae bacterium]|nr:MAG: CRISPR-associated protein CasA/Cse1 [Bryobacteraceae bacterium]